MLKRPLAPILVLLALLLGACSTSPVVKLYEGPKKPVSELAVVRVPLELELLTINDRRVSVGGALFGPGYRDLHLEPGEYRILAYYKDLWDINADTHDVIKSDPSLFVVEAEAGHAYRLGFDEPQNLEQARELEKGFSGYVLDTDTGEKVPSRPSGVAFRSGLLGSLGDIAGVDTLTNAEAEQANEGNQVVKPMAKPETPEKNAGAEEKDSAPAPTGAESGEETGTGYLDMLKAYWSQATPEERRAFLRWISEQK